MHPGLLSPGSTIDLAQPQTGSKKNKKTNKLNKMLKTLISDTNPPNYSQLAMASNPRPVTVTTIEIPLPMSNAPNTDALTSPAQAINSG